MGANNCGATAIVNLMVYYYNGKVFFNLYDNNEWTSAHDEIYQNAGDNSSIWDIAYAIREYTYSRRYVFNPSATALSKDSTMKSNLDNNKPFILNVMGHEYYEEHHVLALGYKQFNYSNGNNRVYYRVADGFTPRSDRYVCPADATLQSSVYVSVP